MCGPHLGWHHILQKSMISSQGRRRRSRWREHSLLGWINSWKQGGITSETVYRWCLKVGRLLLVVEFWEKQWGSSTKRSNGASCFRKNANGATWCNGAWMCVSSFISCNHYWSIFRRPFHSLLHITCCRGATIVAPSLFNNKFKWTNTSINY